MAATVSEAVYEFVFAAAAANLRLWLLSSSACVDVRLPEQGPSVNSGGALQLLYSLARVNRLNSKSSKTMMNVSSLCYSLPSVSVCIQMSLSMRVFPELQ